MIAAQSMWHTDMVTFCFKDRGQELKKAFHGSWALGGAIIALSSRTQGAEVPIYSSINHQSILCVYIYIKSINQSTSCVYIYD